MKTKHVTVSVILGAILALPLGGFVFGFMHCDDCGANVLGRGFIGLVFAVLTPLSGGFPPRNEGGVGPPFNAWPHILVTWALVSGFFLYLAKRKSRRSQTAAPTAAGGRGSS